MSAPDLPEIIDIHTHFMPQRVLDKVWAYFDSAGPLIGRPWPITYREDEGGRLAALRALGVRAFTSLNYAHRPAMAQWLNDWSSEFAAKHDDVLHSATFYPEPGAADYTAAAIEAGARIFKAHVQVGDYSLADPLLDDVWPVLERSRTPIVMHAGNGPAPGRFTGPESVRDLLQRHPGLVLVIAPHGHARLRRLPRHLRRAPRCAPRHDDGLHGLHPGHVTLPPRAHGRPRRARRPGALRQRLPQHPLPLRARGDAVRRLGLGEDWERKALHDNAARLFGIR